MKLVHRPSIILYLPILFLAFVCVGNYYLFLVYFFFDPYIGIPSLLDGSAFEYLGFCSGNHKPILDSTSDGILLLAAYPGIILFLLLLTLVISWVVFDYYTKRCRPVWISQYAIHLGLLRRPFMKKSEISSIGLAPEDPVVPGYYDRKNVIYVACGECRKEDLEQYGVHLLWRQSQFKNRISPRFAAFLFRFEYCRAPYMKQLGLEAMQEIVFAGCNAKIPDKMFWLYFDADKYQMLKDWWEK